MKQAGRFEEYVGRRGFLATMAKGFALIAGFAAWIPRKASGQGSTSGRTRRLLDEDWRFTKGDPVGNSVSLLYEAPRLHHRWKFQS
jgi:hypothetical protein